MATNRKLICVIGAGSSGLTAIKQCVDQDLDVICYEKTENIGGLWRYREENIDGVASVSKSTIINTSKEMSAFSDFVPPAEFPSYMDNQKMCNYFELYAEHYNLLSKVRFNHDVLNVTFNDDYEQTGKWKVTLLNKDLNNSFEKVFDGVMVCCGHHFKPNIPTFVDQEKFKGNIIHTHSYKTWKGFENKVVAVVGIGNSGGDAAVELSRVCEQVYLVARSGSWINYRVNRRGLPLDCVFTTRAINTVFSILPSNIGNPLMEYYLNSFFDHEMYGLKPKHRFLSQHPTANDLIATCILSGKVLIRKNIERFTENGVIFEGMDTETKCDAVILATGYEITFPFLDASIVPVHKNKVRLFKNQFQPNLTHPQTLSIIGLVQPTGAIFPIAEMQSRWFALLMKGLLRKWLRKLNAVSDSSGKLNLPKKDEMLRIMNDDVKAVEKRYYGSVRHTIQVDYINFMDEIATFVGCKPNLFRYAITDPYLWYILYFGPCMSYQYRLSGPNQWSGAREAIINYFERFLAALKA